MYQLSVSAIVASMVYFAPVYAENISDREAFVEANILSIFYHEFGHAVIDLMDVPIFGQEEDAADVMSVLLMDQIFDEDTAQSIAYDSAFGYINDPEQTEEVAYWDLHGPDEQRYYNHVCLFYGANPENREKLAADLGLPDERAEWCPDEYEKAAKSWGAVFDEMDGQVSGKQMVFVPSSGGHSDIANRVLAAEVRNLNIELKLPRRVTVKVETCNEPNAFYDPVEKSITFCTEFVPHLEDLHDKFETQ